LFPDHDSSKGDNLASDADKEGSPQKSTSELRNMKKDTLCNEQISKDNKHSNGLPAISKKKKKKIGNNIPNSDILSGGQEKDNHKRG
jgi:spore germination protein GerM